MNTEEMIGRIVVQFCLIEERVNSINTALATPAQLPLCDGKRPLGKRLTLLGDLLDREGIGANTKAALIAKIREYTHIRNIIAHTAPYHVLDDGSEYFDIKAQDLTINDPKQLQEFYERLCQLVNEVGTLSAQVDFRDEISPAATPPASSPPAPSSPGSSASSRPSP